MQAGPHNPWYNNAEFSLRQIIFLDHPLGIIMPLGSSYNRGRELILDITSGLTLFYEPKRTRNGMREGIGED